MQILVVDSYQEKKQQTIITEKKQEIVISLLNQVAQLLSQLDGYEVYLFISRGKASKMSWSIHFNTLEYRFKTLWVSPWRKQSESTTPQMDDELQNSHNFQ
ncbi:Hypothetical_protein [Hexamita inflata]|uniref:Hypothetical_protein n=1 Tax=Hexamita inflata TaxID=28002 RepID=A0ABP1I0A9_9EUKA